MGASLSDSGRVFESLQVSCKRSGCFAERWFLLLGDSFAWAGQADLIWLVGLNFVPVRIEAFRRPDTSSKAICPSVSTRVLRCRAFG